MRRRSFFSQILFKIQAIFHWKLLKMALNHELNSQFICSSNSSNLFIEFGLFWLIFLQKINRF
jgi:hypothetical protein